MNYFEDNVNVAKVFLVCFVGKRQGTKVHNHRPSHGFAFHTSGVKTYTFSDNKTIEVYANSLIYLPKNCSYVVSSSVEGECYAINFDFSPDIEHTPFCVSVKSAGLFLNYFSEAKKIWDQREPGFELKCKSLLYNILYTLVQEHYLSYAPQSKYLSIRVAVERIHANYASEQLRVDELADMCHFTPEYFRSLFKSYYGVSPIRYINDLKIKKAKGLIETGMYSVSEAATQSGYTDMSHFSREFKRQFGICPSKYVID